MTDLLPCPFCRSSNLRQLEITIAHDSHDEDVDAIECNDCQGRHDNKDGATAAAASLICSGFSARIERRAANLVHTSFDDCRSSLALEECPQVLQAMLDLMDKRGIKHKTRRRMVARRMAELEEQDQ